MSSPGKWICLLCAPAVIAGCVSLPASVQIASLAVSGISYVATGKGPSDHLLSAIIDKDCALLRIVRSRPVCIEPESGTMPEQQLESTQRVAANIKRRVPPRQHNEPPRVRESLMQIYVVIGSFRDPSNAQRWRQQHAGLRAAIVPTGEDQRATQRYRVVLGPFNEAESAQKKTELANTMQTDVWRVRLCEGTLAAPPCPSTARSITIAQR